MVQTSLDESNDGTGPITHRDESRSMKVATVKLTGQQLAKAVGLSGEWTLCGYSISMPTATRDSEVVLDFVDIRDSEDGPLDPFSYAVRGSIRPDNKRPLGRSRR